MLSYYDGRWLDADQHFGRERLSAIVRHYPPVTIASLP